MIRAVGRALLGSIVWPSSRIVGGLANLSLRVVDRLPPSRNGFRIAVPTQDAALRDKVESALDIIAKYDEPGLVIMRRHVRAIIIRLRLGGPRARFLRSPRWCELDGTYLNTACLEEIATLLIHEGEHARREAVGEDYNTENAWAIERACIQAELDFARRLPTGGRLVSQLARQLNEIRWDWVSSGRERPLWMRRLRKVLWGAGTTGS